MPEKKPKWLLFLIGDLILLGAAVFLFFLWKDQFPGGVSYGGKEGASAKTGYETEELEELPETEQIPAPLLPDPRPASFSPHCVPSTDPSNLIVGTDYVENDEVNESSSGFQPWYRMDFGAGADYTDVDGIVTFRGDPFRNSPSFGMASLEENRIEGVWSVETGGLTYGDASWSGSGWTGQPLMERWPKALRSHMNMYDWAKEKDDLMEVIYPCMDGYVYFLDLESGEPTRDKLYLGWTFKGAGALDPRGYPILYVGAGYNSYEGTSRAFIVNLIDCSVMYTFGNDDPYSLRGSLSFFDSSPLVDAASDTLIWPGENGILYLIRLNTDYDPEKGTLLIDPDRFVRWRYYSTRAGDGVFWPGMEDSPAVYEGYLFIADNGGNLLCVDLNTLQIVWAQDILDDSNSTPVLAVEKGKLYLYVSTSFHLGWRSSSSAVVPVWKIDAETGEIVWQTEYECYSQEGVSGGVQSTIALGEHAMDDYLFVTVSRTGDQNGGVLACLSRRTGMIFWEHRAVYSWSSPVCVYRADGSGVVLYCSCGGKMYMLDPDTGEELDSFGLSEGAIEASPAVYRDWVVVGTRGCRIWGIKLH